MTVGWLRSLSLSEQAITRALPMWDGERGGHLLVLHDGGYGDALLLVRHAQTLAHRGCTVYWQTPALLAGVIGTAPGIQQEVGPGTEVDVTTWVRMLDLPRLLGVRPGRPGGAAIPYLRPTWSSRSALWIGPRRFGLCWHGGPRSVIEPGRDLPIPAVEVLIAAVPGVWVSLCPGEAVASVSEGLPAGASFAETAQLITTLDAVVTTDTAVLHLAGAMGAPVTALLPVPGPNPDFVREWYPQVRCLSYGQLGELALWLQRWAAC